MGLFDKFKKKNNYSKFKCRDFAKEFKRNFEEEKNDIQDMSSFFSAWENVCSSDANLAYAKIIVASDRLSDEEMISNYKEVIHANPYDYSLEEWFKFVVTGIIAVKKGESRSNFNKNMADKNYHAYDSVIPAEPVTDDLDDSKRDSHNKEVEEKSDSDLDVSPFATLLNIDMDRSDFIKEHFNVNEIINDYVDAHSFKYLVELINSEESQITLDNDIVLGEDEESIYNDGITLNGDVVIDGNDHIIDCLGKICFFNINGENIVFKNINFKNLHSRDASAIINNSKYLTFENCTFYNCVSGKTGFIENKSGNSIDFNSCNFEDIFGALRGTIVNNSGNINLLECNFDNCKANMGASITNIVGDVNIEDCNFNNCLTDGYGGAILNRGGTLEINSSNFNGNSSKYGGAIHNENTLILEDCNFTKNTCSLEGGQILNKGPECSVSNCNFDEGSSDISGGSILNYGTMEINDCIFENGYAKMGGAIVNIKNMNVNSCIFESNVGTDGGGAIFNHDQGEIVFKECNFEKNTSNLGGGIDNRGKASYYDCIFEKNEGTQVGGGAVLNNGAISLENCDFDGNFGKLAGGAIFVGKGELNITNCNFNENRNDSFQGSSTLFIVDFTGEIKDCNFADNMGEGIEVSLEDGTCSLENCVFERGVKNQIRISNVTLTIKSCTFDEDYSISNSGTIKVSSDEKSYIDNMVCGGNVEII